MTDREAMQLALVALEWNLPVIEDYGDHEQLNRQHRAIIALRERLAQPEQPSVPWSAALEAVWGEPEQEPIAWVTGWHDGHCVIRAADPALILPIGAALYTTPPQRKPEQEPIKESSATHSHLWIGDLYGKEKNT